MNENLIKRVEILSKKLNIDELVQEKILEKVGENRYRVLDMDRLPRKIIKRIKKTLVTDEVIVEFLDPKNILEIITD